MATKQLTTQEQVVFSQNIPGLTVTQILNYRGKEKDSIEEVKEDDFGKDVEISHEVPHKQEGSKKKKLFGLIKRGSNSTESVADQQQKSPSLTTPLRPVDFLGGGFVPKVVKSSKKQEQTKQPSPKVNIVNQILSGAQGNIYKCRFQGQEYALKLFLSPKTTQDNTLNKELTNFIEVDIGSRIVSDYIVPIVRLFTPQDTGNFKVYASLTHLGKGDLHSLLSSKAVKLSKECTIGIVRDLIGGVVQLHEQDIYHMNLKSENVLILESGDKEEGYSAKLNDFKFCIYHEGVKSFQEQCAISRAYAPPEYLYEDSYFINEKTDVWSLSIVLLELLLGDVAISERVYELIKSNFESGDTSLASLKDYINGLLQKVSGLYGQKLASQVLAGGLCLNHEDRLDIFEMREAFTYAYPKLTFSPYSLRAPKRYPVRNVNEMNKAAIYQDITTLLDAARSLASDTSTGVVKRCSQPSMICAAIEFYLGSISSVNLDSDDDRKVLVNVAFSVANSLFNRKGDRFATLLPYDKELGTVLEQKILKDKGYILYSPTLYGISPNNYILEELTKKYTDLSFLEIDTGRLTTTEKDVELLDLISSISNNLTRRQQSFRLTPIRKSSSASSETSIAYEQPQ